MLEFRIQVMAMDSMFMLPMFMLPMLALLQRQGCIVHHEYSSGLNNAFLDPFYSPCCGTSKSSPELCFVPSRRMQVTANEHFCAIVGCHCL